MDGWMMTGGLHEYMDRCTVKVRYGCINEWIDGWTEEIRNGWMIENEWWLLGVLVE